MEGFDVTALTNGASDMTQYLLVANDQAGADMEGFEISIILVVGPPDPGLLPELLPLEVFERGAPILVAAIAHDDPKPLYTMLDMIEIMDTGDIAVFLCEDETTLLHASHALQPDNRSEH